MSFMRSFRIPCHHTALLFVSSHSLTGGSLFYDEIPRSSQGMTKNASRGMTQSGQGGDFYRDCPVKPDNDTILEFPVIPQLDWGISIWNSRFLLAFGLDKSSPACKFLRATP